MRIAFVTEVFLPAVDGVVTRLRHTLEELERVGDQVLVLAPAGGPSSYAGAEVVAMPALPMPLYPDGVGYPEKRVSLPCRALGRELRRFRPDVIHAINPMLLAAGGVRHARRQEVPLVASYHANIPSYARYYGLGRLEPLGWRYVRWLHNAADLNLATSTATLGLLREHKIGRLALWPYGVEPEFVVRRAADPAVRERLGGGHPERPLLLYVGRLAKEKDVAQLRALVDRRSDASLAIVGDGPLRSELEALFAGTPARFHGILRGDELAAAYANADVFVFPSRSETLGLVMLEAHTAGLPVVAADSAASRELVRHGVDGLRYDPDAPGSLAAAVDSILGDPELARSMSEQARAAVATASWEHATRILREHYADVLDVSVRPRAPVVALPVRSRPIAPAQVDRPPRPDAGDATAADRGA
jgi:glycosyltransferase involved in cell wall biosynthesis